MRHASGPVQFADFGNGKRETTELDSRLRASRIDVRTPGGSPIADRSYTFQANSNISRIADAVTPGKSQNFTYDALNRIWRGWSDASSGADAWGQEYVIDPWANLTKKQAYDGTRPNPESLDQSAQPENVITGFSYDAAGNMTQNGSASYAWDAESRLASSTGAGGTTTYTYDANGMRVRKQTGSAWTEYIYFGGNVIAEKDQSGAWTDYIFAGGKRVAKAPAEAVTTNTEYYHSDHLGTASWMTNASGAQVYSATYLPYGYELNASGSTANHYKFTGKERDAESNLDYFGARYYATPRAVG